MTAFADGSISMRLYPHNDLPAPEIVAELRAQARLAVESGFDGVMTSEHHGGFSGYMPQPLQMTGFLLGAMPTGWAAPCPMLLPVRSVAHVAEEVAWLDASFPGRVGVGVAPGALPLDFEVAEVPFDEAMPRYRRDLPRLVAMLRGAGLGPVEGDPALAACAKDPVPVLSTAMSPPAVARAARAGAGLVYDGGTVVSRLATLSAAYRDAGGTAPIALIRRVWLGAPPQEALDRQHAVYRSYSPESAQQHWRDDGFLIRSDPAELAGEVAAAWKESAATTLNLRVHVDGVTPGAAREQIERLGAEVVPLVRRATA